MVDWILVTMILVTRILVLYGVGIVDRRQLGLGWGKHCWLVLD